MPYLKDDDFGAPEQEFCCSIGACGEILFTTPAMTDFLAYRRDELEMRHFADLLHPDDYANALEQFAALRSHAKRIVFTARYKASSGTYSKLNWVLERCGRMFTATAKLAN